MARIPIAQFKNRLAVGDFDDVEYNAQDQPIAKFTEHKSCWYADYSISILASLQMNGTVAKGTRVVAVRPEAKISADDYIKIGDQCYTISNINRTTTLNNYDLLTLAEYDATKQNNTSGDDDASDDGDYA